MRGPGSVSARPSPSTISGADIASALKSSLEGYEPSYEARTVGRVAEVGSHDELVAAGGAYATLFDAWTANL